MAAAHHGTKRSAELAVQPDQLPKLQPSPTYSPTAVIPPIVTPKSSSAASSAFRNVSACNRCRIRKNRCDQRLPACLACEKVNARCTGYDPISKREIPRSYVFYLESRQTYLESLLRANGIAFDSPELFDTGKKDGEVLPRSPDPEDAMEKKSPRQERDISNKDPSRSAMEEEKIDSLVSDIGLVSVRGTSDSRYLGATSGISFARLVLAAVKNTVSSANSERSGVRPSRPIGGHSTSNGKTMRDSYFGLQTKSTMQKAPFPDRSLGEKLSNLYFEHANPQAPILHRGEFLKMFDRVFDSGEPTSRELYQLNIVFAIGAGIIFGSSDSEPDEHPGRASKRPRLSGVQHQPEAYHSAAVEHLGALLGSEGDTGADSLEVLQAVLLLANFALLRPIHPGLWYISGVAVRLAVDLGLHVEDTSLATTGPQKRRNSADLSVDVDMRDQNETNRQTQTIPESGYRDWLRDRKRRLWWCVYGFDRLVSTCVGRPFGITDLVISTEFPSLLDDKYVTKEGIVRPEQPDAPSYKVVSYHYFRLRLLQSEIVQVIQQQQAVVIRKNGINAKNAFMHTKILSPYLLPFDNDFRAWRKDIDRRLYEWKQAIPTQHETGVNFRIEFLELNYWQVVTTLYRQSLEAPSPLANEASPTADVVSPTSTRTEDPEDEDEVYLKCAEAGQQTLKLYRQLHRIRLVNYTYLATHHLFMAGISFLFAIWHSKVVRSRLTLDEVDFTILAATSVLEDLMEKCPPAEACRDVFQRMAKTTVQMFASAFGSARSEHRPLKSSMDQSRPPSTFGDDSYFQNATILKQEYRSPSHQYIAPKPPTNTRRPPPRFDTDLRDLFADNDLTTNTLTSQSITKPTSRKIRTTAHPQRGEVQEQTHTQYRPNLSERNHLATILSTSPADTTRSTGSIGTSQPQFQTVPLTGSPSSGQPPMPSDPGQYDQPYPNYSDYMSVDYDTSAFFDNLPEDVDPALFQSSVVDDNFLYDPGFGVGGFDFTHDWGGNLDTANAPTAANGAPPAFGVDLMDGYWFGGSGSGGGAS